MAALVLGFVPFLGMCFSVPLWDRVHPMLLGLPFNMLWLVCWIVISSLCLWAVYGLERARERRAAGNP